MSLVEKGYREVAVTEDVYTVQLTEPQAKILHAVLAKVGGPYDGPRAFINDLDLAFKAVLGQPCYESLDELVAKIRYIDGNIIFGEWNSA